MEHSTPDGHTPATPPAEDATSRTDGPAHPQAGEALSQLADRAASILERWAAAGERQERALHQFESQVAEFEVASARMQRDASQKMQDLERAVQHEWTALREVHAEPVRQLREQANSLTEVAIATAHSAQRGFDQAEARLAAIEVELQQRILELRRELQTVVAELRESQQVRRIGASSPAWPLDGVTRLHQQLRQEAEPPPPDTSFLESPVHEAPNLGDEHVSEPTPESTFESAARLEPEIELEPTLGPEPVHDISMEPLLTVLERLDEATTARVPAPAVEPEPTPPTEPAPEPMAETVAEPTPTITAEPAAEGGPELSPGELPHAPVPSDLVESQHAGPDLAERVRELQRAIDERETEAREVAERAHRSAVGLRMAVIGLCIVIVLAVGTAVWLQRQVSSSVEDAQRRAQEVTAAAAQETAATREQAAREIAEAREMATRAQRVSAVLAAPDMVRFNMVAADQNSSGSAQALWSRTRGFVLSGSNLRPAPQGKTYQVWLLARGQTLSVGTFAPDEDGLVTLAVAPPPTTLPIFSVVVSLEPSGGSARPDGPPVLIRTRAQP